MTGLDAKFLYSETPTSHMHTVKMVVANLSSLEGGFSYDDLLTVIAEQLIRLPPFRRRAVPVPWGLGHPVWIEDPGFDLSRHVTRTALDPPGDDHRLAEAVADFSGTPLARDRPLWQLLVVEGRAGGRRGVVLKLHHALADGSAAVALLQRVVLGITETATAAPEPDRWEPEPVPDRRQLLAIAAHDHAARLRGLPHLVAQSATRTRASEVRRRSFAVKPPLPLHHVPKTSLNVSLTPERTFAMVDLPLDELKAVRRAVGTTLNDVYLAVCAGALRWYLADRGELPDRSLVASVPVSTDPNAARLTGNRVDNLYVNIGTEVDDPLARLRAIRDATRASKEVRDLLGHELLAQRADVIPPQLYGSSVRIWSRTHLADRVRPPLNVILSNVAGPRERILLGPVELEALYSVGPILEGIGLNITAWSYVDTLGVSLLGCPASVPNPWVIADALPVALDELRAAVDAAGLTG
jgi:diacylglycerol O-acyltransferase